VDASRYGEEAVLEAALMAGAEDVSDTDGEFLVSTDATAFHQVQEGLKQAGVEFAQAELAMVPANELRVEGREAAQLLKLLDALDDHDDVQKVWSNANIDEQVMAEVMS